MAQVVNVKAPDLAQAAATVAQHMQTAATPPTAAAPPPAAASPADVAASGAAGAIQTKMAALSTELAPKGPAMQQVGTGTAAALQAQDTTNASRIATVHPEPAPPHTHKPDIQAVDRTWKKDPAPPPPPAPDPVTTLHLPNYNPGTLSNDEARTVYLQGEQRMRELNDQLAKQGVSAQDRAKIMFDQRNALRSWARTLMSDRALADQLNETERNLTWDQLIAKLQARGLRGDDLWNALIDSASRSRPSVNDALGIDPDHPPPLPPIHPLPPPATGPGTAPIISAPPDLPPIGQHPAPGPLPPTVFDHPPTTALPPQVLDHPPLPPWLQDPSPPGFHVTPSEPPPIFNWDVPDPPPAPPPMPAPAGPPVTVPMPSIQPPTAQQEGVLGTIVIVLGALGAFVASGGGILSGG